MQKALPVKKPAQAAIASSRTYRVNSLISGLGSRRYELKRIVNDHTSSPGMGPIPESCVVFGGQFKAGHSTLFRLCAICSQEIGEEIKPGPILRGCPSVSIKCRVLSPALIRGGNDITVIHLPLLICSAASNGNPPYRQLRALACLLARRCGEAPSHFNL